MKKALSLILSLLLCVGLFAGCTKTNTNEPTVETSYNNETETQKDDGVMKILMIGHSTGMDSAHMLPAIAKNEGVEKLVVGMLYHSGCRLGQHVEYLTNDAAQYAYYEFDIETQDAWLRANSQGDFIHCEPFAKNDIYIEDGSIAQTMKFGIQRHDWDIIVMQPGCFEAANKTDGGYTPNFDADIQTIRNYVLENDIEKSTIPQFAWNMIWGCPDDNSMWNETYAAKMSETFNNDTVAMYVAITETTKNLITPETSFDYFMPSATALRNAQALGLAPNQIYRDTIHASDFTRVMVSYLWYCILFNKNIEDCEITPIFSKLAFDYKLYNTGEDLVLTEEQKTILKTSIKNALVNPYEITE